MSWYPYIWGKTVRNPLPGQPDYHHLACHLLDVGAAAEALLMDERARFLLRRLAHALGCDAEALARVLPLLIASHDLGKASPSFLEKGAAQAERLRQHGAPWPVKVEKPFFHDLELARSLADLLPELGILTVEARNPRPFWNAVSHGVTAHHGHFFKPDELDPRSHPAEVPIATTGESWRGEWLAARRRLVREVRAVLCPEAPPVPCRPRNLSAVAMLLNGFTILCDWIGSDAELFPARGYPDLATYAVDARAAARRGIQERGLLSHLPAVEEPHFAALFPERKESIRPLQEALDRGGNCPLPEQCLVLIEAAMGEGKTEAAWLLSRRLSWAHGSAFGGCYFALPTVATSNQMYERVKRFLRDACPDGGKTLLAPVNGLAEFHPDVRRELRNTDGPQEYDEEQSVHYNTWFLPRKRSLLAPYGVGTIDQALLAGLNTRHVGLRLLGLAGKVVIIDEVHAYDLYMSTILDRLLLWLKELGASVILLSATLPSERRAKLLEIFGGSAKSSPAGEEAPYPLVSIASPAAPVAPLTCKSSGRDVNVEVIRRTDGNQNRTANVGWLLERIVPGTRALWICNTVGEAQAVFRELEKQVEDFPKSQRPDLCLFHARFPQQERAAIENDVLKRFGPPSGGEEHAGKAVILVATQVVEQSLDLDFDLMVSQLAPVDLLLQRLGRLHRHAERHRPEPHRQPRLVLLVPPVGANGPDWGRYRKVYEPLVLLRTILALSELEETDRIRIPDEIRPLVERVYAPLDMLPDDPQAERVNLRREWFQQAADRKQKDDQRPKQEAQLRLLMAPHPKTFGGAPNFLLDEDAAEAMLSVQGSEALGSPGEDPDEPELQMQTRLGEPTLQAILLENADPLLQAARTRASLTPEQVEALLQRRVSLSHAGLVNWAGTPPFENHPELLPPSFKASNALRRMALLPLDAQRCFRWQTTTGEDSLRLDSKLGVVYRRDEEETL